MQRPRWAGTAAGLLLATVVLAGCGGGNDDQNSLKPDGEFARTIMDLFTPFFWIATVIGIGVTAATIYVALRFREKPGEENNPKQVHGNTVLEISWTIVPALILAIMAVFTVPVIFDLAEEPDDSIQINVIGKQWWWEYEYADEGFTTANELHIPEGKTISLHVSSPGSGVIHSFWVPNLNGKKDAVPGRDEFLKLKADEGLVESDDETVMFQGQCAEYCGLSHANMRIRVFVHTQAGYEQWLADQKSNLSNDGVAYVNETLAQWQCANCHAFQGVEGATSNVGPNLTHFGDRSTFAAGILETTIENLTNWIYDAPHEKPAGPLVGWMPSFKNATEYEGLEFERDMTQDEAEEIARFLMCDTFTESTENQENIDEECGG